LLESLLDRFKSTKQLVADQRKLQTRYKDAIELENAKKETARLQKQLAELRKAA
jgi:hypothetical protein